MAKTPVKPAAKSKAVSKAATPGKAATNSKVGKSKQAASGHMPASSALARFKVLDLTRARSGPTCARQLADWGADVIKVELPESSDQGDGIGGARSGPDFQNLHRNKRGITLDLKSAEGLAVFKRLADQVDVIIENFRPDVKTRLGIDYEQLSTTNPRLIYGSISGFGQTGPYQKRPGFDQIAQGMGGLMSITGEPGRGPMRVGIPIADLTSGLFLANGVLTALLEREVTGKGQWVQTSLLQAQIFMLDFQASRYINDDYVPDQAGNNHPTSIPTGVFQTADGNMNIAASGQNMWVKLCETIGGADVLANPAFATSASRLKHRDAVNAALQTHLLKQTTEHWVAALNKAGVPTGPIYAIDEMFADPQVKHVGIVQTIERTGGKKPLKVIAQPVLLSRTPSCPTRVPPERGEHSAEILNEFGFAKGEVADLMKSGIIPG
jgi:crotonobetainyl-CoA:carnitine CoA-transferase CaiB-like acyl-CoA transferase